MDLAAQDQAQNLTDINTELKRLLKKEQLITDAFVNAPDPPPLGSCSQCASNRAAFLAVRQDNMQEYRWVVYFQKKSHEMQSKLQTKLAELEAAHSSLQIRHRDLEQRKTDPFCRDSEIVRIRDSLAEMRQNFLNANQTAFLANRESEKLSQDLCAERERAGALETELRIANDRIRQLQDTVDTYRQAPELKDLPVAQCADFRCRKRELQAQLRQRELEAEVAQLKAEKQRLGEDVKRHKTNNLGLMERLERGVEGGSKLAPLFYQLEQSDKVSKANLEGLDDLVMKLKNFFVISPALDEEYEECAMYTDFLLDTPADEREATIAAMWAACNRGQALPASKLERFRSKSTDRRPELVCRSCFAACMIALGGNFRRSGGKTIWRNVQAIRRPIV